MIAFITGGTSFIGRHLIDQFLKSGPFSEIRMLTRTRPKVMKDHEPEDRLVWIEGDIRAPETFAEKLEDVTHFFHLAALASDRASFQEMNSINVIGTRLLLDSLRKKAKNTLDFFFLMSTTGVYGTKLPKKNEAIKETFPKKPTHPYHVTKWLQEQTCWKAREEWNLPLTVFRPPMTLGPGDYKTFPTMVSAVKNNKFPIIGNGNNVLSLIDVRDLVNAIKMATDNPKKSIGEAFNLLSFKVTLNELHQEVRKIVGTNSSPKRYPYWLIYGLAFISEMKDKLLGTKSTLNRYRIQKFAATRIYDDSRIQTLLGFKPRYSLSITLRDAWNWYLYGKWEKPAYQ